MFVPHLIPGGFQWQYPLLLFFFGEKFKSLEGGYWLVFSTCRLKQETC